MFRISFFVLTLIYCVITEPLGTSFSCSTLNQAAQRTQLDSSVRQIEYSTDSEHSSVWIVTTLGTLLHSTDQGKNWNTLNSTHLIGSDESFFSVPFFNSWVTALGRSGSGVREIFTTDTDPNTAYFLGFGTNLWTTRDNGATFTRYNTGETLVFDIKIHPKNPGYLIAFGASRECTSVFNANACSATECVFSLLMSKNFGANWTTVENWISEYNVPLTYSWGRVKTSTDDSVFLISYKESARNINQQCNALNNMEFRSIGGDADLYFDESYAFLYHDHLDSLLVAQVNNDVDPPASDIMLVQENQIPQKINFPTRPENRDLVHRDLGIRFFTSDAGTIFVSLVRNVESTGARFEDLFVSDMFSSGFSLSLRNFLSFRHIQGIEGVAIAQTDLSAGTWKAKITFDNGGFWTDIAPPTGRDNVHVFNVLSKDTATGVLVAQGQVGYSYVVANSADDKTLLSRDAGRTWKVLGGVSEYNMANHGNLIVMLNKTAPKLSFTVDGGATVLECDYETSTNTWAGNNVYTDPAGKFRHFLLEATETDENATSTHYIYYQDLSLAHNRECEGVDNPDTAGSDYETWTPHSPESSCVLGKKLTYIRKKESAECHVPDDFDPSTIISVEICPCTREDYSCQLCFGTVISDRCQLVCDEHPDPAPSGCFFPNRYTVSTNGYHKINSSSCVGGVQLRDLGAFEYSCPPAIPPVVPMTVAAPTIVQTPPPTGSAGASEESVASTSALSVGAVVALVILVVILVVLVVLTIIMYIATKHQ